MHDLLKNTIQRLLELEKELAHLGRRMTRTQATAENCRAKATAIRVDLEAHLNEETSNVDRA